MRSGLMALAIMVGLSVPALADTAPWPANHWRADVEDVVNGQKRHLTMIGTETGHGTRIALTCTVRNLATGATQVHHATAGALMRQDDWEGDAGALGSFGSHDGKMLRWFDASPCPSGRMVWRRL